MGVPYKLLRKQAKHKIKAQIHLQCLWFRREALSLQLKFKLYWDKLQVNCTIHKKQAKVAFFIVPNFQLNFLLFPPSFRKSVNIKFRDLDSYYWMSDLKILKILYIKTHTTFGSKFQHKIIFPQFSAEN